MELKHETLTPPLSKKQALQIINDLRNKDEHSSSISGTRLNFHGISLTNEDLSGLDFSEADFSEADLTGADLSGARLFKANLQKASLFKANLHRADLTGADLSNANLEEANCCEAGLGMATLIDTHLFNVKLRGSTLSKATLKRVDLRCADMKYSRLRETKLINSYLTEANLQGAILSLCDVDGSFFNNADLRDARLRNIKNYETAEWIGVDIRDINFAGAYTLRRFIIDQNYLKEFKERNKLSRMLYYLWWATSDCGRSFIRWCGCIMFLAVLFAWIYTFADIDFKNDPSWISSLYFSIVTMTTLGYGDIVPVSSGARIIAMLEVITGYLMLGGLLTIFNNKMARRSE
jgi:uncharacterized protein YjbI with pentapeptide repeats